MNTIPVYQYDYFDRVLKCNRRSDDFATSDAVQEMGATILSDTVRFVDEEVIDDRGHVKWADVPPRIPGEGRMHADKLRPPRR